MPITRISFVVAFVGVGFYYFNPIQFKARLPLHFGGYVKKGFEAVEEAFKSNYEKGWDHEGSAFAVCDSNGEIVVDLWGGYANYEKSVKWQQDTMTVGFSTTKVVAAICLALLVDRNLISYDDLVVKYWPEFGTNGKENVTVRMLASHQSGLVVFDKNLTYDLIDDHEAMSHVIENQKPNWTPSNESFGYHIMTHGFIIDQLIRRVDPQNRSLGSFFRQEIGQPYDLDFYIGLPAELENRVARVIDAPSRRFLLEMWDFKYLYVIYHAKMQRSDSILDRALKNPEWILPKKEGDESHFNEPELHRLEIGAANGIGTARSMAKLLCLFSLGKIVNLKTLDLIRKPLFIKTFDLVLNVPMSNGHGFEYSPDPYTNEYTLLGHSGYGGQNAKADLQRNISMVYYRNGLSHLVGDLNWSYKNLKHALYESIAKNNR